MNMEEEYGRKRMSYKRCQKCYNFIAIYYIIIWGFILFAELYLGVIGGSLAYLFGALISGATLAAGFCGAYLHKNIFAVSAPVLSVFNMIGVLGLILFTPVCILCAVLNVLANKKYQWLEQQDGFPYFNVRYRDQEIDKTQWNIKDPYTQNYEELKKKNDNNGQMDEL